MYSSTAFLDPYSVRAYCCDRGPQPQFFEKVYLTPSHFAVIAKLTCEMGYVRRCTQTLAQCCSAAKRPMRCSKGQTCLTSPNSSHVDGVMCSWDARQTQQRKAASEAENLAQQKRELVSELVTQLTLHSRSNRHTATTKGGAQPVSDGRSYRQ